MRDGTSLSGLGIQWMGQLQPSEKLSPAAGWKAGGRPGARRSWWNFTPMFPTSEARAIAIETGAAIHDNPDLLPHHLLIEGTVDQVRRLADWDEVSYIFPASTDLIRGLPVHGCAGALTTAGPVGQAVPLVGYGWDGPGLGSANLNYAFVYVTAAAAGGFSGVGDRARLRGMGQVCAGYVYSDQRSHRAADTGRAVCQRRARRWISVYRPNRSAGAHFLSLSSQSGADCRRPAFQ